MAKNVSLASLRESARQRADQVNSGFVTDAELTNYINLSLTELYDLLVDAYGEDYYTKNPPELITTTGLDNYPLPLDFYKLQGVDLQIDSVTFRTLRPFMMAERNRYRLNGGWGEQTNMYKINGNRIYFLPLPPAGKVFRLWYVPVCPTLVNGTDEFDFINGWEEYVIIDAAIKMMIKEESSIQELLIQKNAMTQRLIKMKKDRDIGSPLRIVDVRRNGMDFDGYELDEYIW